MATRENANTYTNTVERVRRWANRIDSAGSLPNETIQDAMDFAADESYRLLEVASLEYTGTYPALVSSDIEMIAGRGVGTLRVPRDSTGNFIQVRRVGGNGRPAESEVYNTRQDLRGFEDQYTNVADYSAWTRKGNNILVAPAVVGDTFEIHYYRRLPALNAQYTVNASNWQNRLLEFSEDNAIVIPTAGELSNTGTTPLWFPTGTPTTVAPAPVTTITPTTSMTTENTVQLNFVGEESFNWLREEQNKIILFGALWHISDYLENFQEGQAWAQKFQLEIESLNKEERMRRASGGNPTITFEANNLI